MKKFKIGDRILHTVFDMECTVIRIDGGIVWYRADQGGISTIDFDHLKYWVKLE